MGTDVTGRHAETVYRDKQSGKRVEGGAAELEALEESRKKPKSEAPAWGGGIAQVPPLSSLYKLYSPMQLITTGGLLSSGYTAQCGIAHSFDEGLCCITHLMPWKKYWPGISWASWAEVQCWQYHLKFSAGVDPG